MNYISGSIEHPAHSPRRVLEDIEAQNAARQRIETAYVSVVENPTELAATTITAIADLDKLSHTFESQNVKQLLGSDIPRKTVDVPLFEEYYTLAGNQERAGERVIWFGQQAVRAFNGDCSVDKVATELGGKKLWGNASSITPVLQFEHEAIRQLHASNLIRGLDTFEDREPEHLRSITLEPLYLNKDKSTFSSQYALLRARQMIADVYMTDFTKVELFRATHWLIVSDALPAQTSNGIHEAIQHSHDALQSGESSYSPPAAEELHDAAKYATQLPAEFIPLTTRSLALMRRPSKHV